MNPRITKKERALIRGAIRRVFSRSDLRKAIMDAAEISYKDPKRPRVTRWVLCAICRQPEAKYETQCDHIDPVQRVTDREEDIEIEDFVNRVWCSPINLQVVCKNCHHKKSKEENAQRRKHKKELKNGRN